MSTTTIILNPWAGRGKAGRRQEALEAALQRAGISYTLVRTNGRDHATQLARDAVVAGSDVVIAIGGDGTLNEVVNGVVEGNLASGRRAAFGVIPLGTGSDFVKVLEDVAADDIEGGIRRILENRRRPIDLGLVEVPGQVKRYLLNAVGVGFDAQAAAEALKFKRLTGWLVYYLAILKALINYKAFPMKISFRDEVVERRMMFCTIANGRCQGAGFWLTPDAHIDDGQMDMCMVDIIGVVKVLQYIPLIQKAAHKNLPEVRMERTPLIHITCENDLPVAIDGEVVSTTARDITVTACPGIVDLLH
jgi:YegS/Rv2252/BmrU family lipid kinase